MVSIKKESKQMQNIDRFSRAISALEGLSMNNDIHRNIKKSVIDVLITLKIK
jgi:hypothetical protein